MSRGTKLQIFAVLTVLVATFGFTTPASAGGKANKVDVCHVDDDGIYKLISVSQKAQKAHTEHGDGSPGGTVPGTIDTFADDCTIIPAPPTAVACATLGGAYTDDGVGISNCGPISGLTLTEWLATLDIWNPACLATSDTANPTATLILTIPSVATYRCNY